MTIRLRLSEREPNTKREVVAEAFVDLNMREEWSGEVVEELLRFLRAEVDRRVRQLQAEEDQSWLPN